MKKIDYYEITNQKLKYLKYSENTIRVYLYYISEFLFETKNVCPTRLTSNDFQNYLNSYNFSSISQQNQVINSIKFLYEKILDKKYNKIDFSRPRNQKRLPRVIDCDFLKQKISKINNLKHKTIISIAFSTGMRVSEVINLRISDIDSKRMVINIKNGKGGKDRTVPLSPNILILLRKYWMEYKPKEYLFNGQSSLKYSTTSCNKIVKKYIGNDYHFHLLRHSCFTFLLESGIDIRIIQKIAGHISIKTTEIYTHVSNRVFKTIQLPI